MSNQKVHSSAEIKNAKLKILGGLILCGSALLASFTGLPYLILFGIVGIFLFGLDAYKRGKLGSFLLTLGIYTLLFAIIIYLQFKGIPWG